MCCNAPLLVKTLNALITGKGLDAVSDDYDHEDAPDMHPPAITAEMVEAGTFAQPIQAKMLQYQRSLTPQELEDMIRSILGNKILQKAAMAAE